MFSASLGYAQDFVIVDKLPEESDVVYNEQEYNALLNYTPKAFVADAKSKPQNRVLDGELNSIGSIELRYAYQQQLNLKAAEIKWLEDEINALAIAFFTEGKPIIIKRAGNYSGCTGRGTETEQRNGFTITVFHFCYTYSNAEAFENRFLEIFNNRTEKLMAAKQ